MEGAIRELQAQIYSECQELECGRDLELLSEAREVLKALWALGLREDALDCPQQRVGQLTELWELSKGLAEVWDSLCGFEAALSQDLLVAAEVLCRHSRFIELWAGTGSQLIREMQKKAAWARGRTVEELQRAWDEAVCFREEAIVMRGVLVGERLVTASDLLKVFDLLGLKQGKIREITEKLYDSLYTSTSRVAEEFKGENSVEIHFTGEAKDLTKVLENLSKLLNFFNRTLGVLLPAEKLIEMVKREIERNLTLFVCSENYKARTLVKIEEFENLLKDNEIVGNSFSEFSNLVKLSDHSFIKHKKIANLLEIRDLITAQNSATVEITGKTVSLNTYKLIEKLTETLEEALRLPAHLLLELVQQLRRALTLYVGLRTYEPHDSLRVACLFYTDSHYIAEHLAQLYSTYSSRLPHALQRALYFQDFTLILRTESEKSLCTALECSIMASLQPLSEIDLQDIEQNYNQYELLCEDSLSAIAEDSAVLKGILCSEECSVRTGKLCDSLFQLFIALLLKMKDICAEDIPLITQLYSKLFSVKTLFNGSHRTHCRLWDKLKSVLILLDLDLSGILKLRSTEKFRNRLSYYETRQLVVSLFEDSESREQALQQLV